MKVAYLTVLLTGFASGPLYATSACTDVVVEPLSLDDLAPLSDEEKVILSQLEAIEADEAISKQAASEAEVPLSAFGGNCPPTMATTDSHQE